MSGHDDSGTSEVPASLSGVHFHSTRRLVPRCSVPEGGGASFRSLAFQFAPYLLTLSPGRMPLLPDYWADAGQETAADVSRSYTTST
ncbi:hypothetical protein GE21DRAFT_1210231 [Neurospora crassa]|nr:hypothetical protein GE21DRAFT_1210231 [Neurospora crassa]